MIGFGLLARKRHHTPCTIEIEHSERSLHAHVNLDQRFDLQPGDRVLVHGDPIKVSFGETLVLRRNATVERASWIERQFTRLASRFELSELYEVSFTTRRMS